MLPSGSKEPLSTAVGSTEARQVIEGGRLSLTVTTKEQPAPTLLVQTTEVLPLAKELPEPGVQVTVPQFPVRVGAANVTVAPHCPGAVVVTMSAGQDTVHAVTA